MSNLRFSSRGFSQRVGNAAHCLWRGYRASSTPAPRNCSSSKQTQHISSAQAPIRQQWISARRIELEPKPRLSNRTQTTFPQARRHFSATAASLHNELTPPKPGEGLHITFVDKEGDEHTFEVAKGDNLLDIALENDIEMEGACGGSCACSTCHVIVEDDTMYEKMDEPDDDENDMLDLAFGLTETSRLGCQVKMTKGLDGLRVRLPAMTRNLQASDFSKKNERSES